MNKKGTKGLERFYFAKWGSAMDPSGFSKVKKIDGQGKKKRRINITQISDYYGAAMIILDKSPPMDDVEGPVEKSSGRLKPMLIMQKGSI
ncbi:hypothetical protein [Desulfosarcina sp.]|uniref:hypothetical protein n=1 Tax=Desulfosarcina sp. TaxID=2027861 RepID=UPI003971020F